MKRKIKGKWYVYSESGRGMGGPYKTEEQANERLRQLEYFKKKGHIKTNE
jgi:hypothetical protein